MDRGGIESMLMNYYRHLDRTRFQFDFLVNKKKPGFFDDEIRALGGRIFQTHYASVQYAYLFRHFV